MRGNKGCFVCRQNHLTRYRPNEKEIVDAIGKLKSNIPSALFNVEDLSRIQSEIKADDDETVEGLSD